MNEIPEVCPANLNELQVLIRRICEWVETAAQFGELIRNPDWIAVIEFLSNCAI